MGKEICVNEYIRTKKGNIGKVIDISNVTCQKRKKYLIKWGISKAYYITGTTITKHSFNIIDLIEEGDYVNGEKIIEIIEPNESVDNIRILCGVQDWYYYNDIKTIVTHEQMEEREYKVC